MTVICKKTAWADCHSHHEVFGDGAGNDQGSKGCNNKSEHKKCLFLDRFIGEKLKGK